ncbi:MAG: phage antirepressor KilAC domain-containing protein [Burkholderiaceae bacterium]
MSEIAIMSAASMSSQEIADLVESRHDSVKRTIERLANQGVISLPPLVEVKIQRERREETVSVYQFTGEQGKRDSIIVVAQLSPEFTARLVDRWQMLESRLAKRDPMEMLNDPAALRQALLGYSEKVIALEEKVQEQAPKVEVHGRIADAEGSITIREAANTLRVPERKFVLWLQQNDWVYRRSGHKSLLGYAEKVKAGHLYLKQTPIRDIHTGEERLSEQVRITPLGLIVLARRLAKDGQQMDVPPGMLTEPMASGPYAERRA